MTFSSDSEEPTGVSLSTFLTIVIEVATSDKGRKQPTQSNNRCIHRQGQKHQEWVIQPKQIYEQQ